jgi:hypothetical protein
MFTAAEALGLVMAVLEGHGAADPADPAGSAVSKIIRVLPEQVARPADAVRSMSARSPETGTASPDLETTAVLVQACASRRRLRLGYRLEPGRERAMDVDPWAVTSKRSAPAAAAWSPPPMSPTGTLGSSRRSPRRSVSSSHPSSGKPPLFSGGVSSGPRANPAGDSPEPAWYRPG